MVGIEATTGGIVYGTGEFYNSILNDLFLPVMADTVIYPNALLKRLPRDSSRVEGKQVKYPVHYDDAAGVVAIGPDGTLPEPDSEHYAQYAFGIAHIYVRMKFDGVTKDATQNQLASWLKVVESEAKAKSLTFARARQRMYWGDSTGILCEVTAYGAPTVTVQLPQGIPGAVTCGSNPTRFLKVNQRVAFIDGAGDIIANARVASVPSPTTFTIDTITGVPVATHDVVLAATTGLTLGSAVDIESTSYQREPMGLSGIISDTNPPTYSQFQNIDASAAGNSWHRANVLSNSNILRPLTLGLLDLGWTTNIEIGDTVPTVIWMSFALTRKLGALMIANRRWDGEAKTFDGGYDALPYNGVPVIADRDIWNNQIFLPNENDFTVHVMADPQWMDMDGSIYHRLSDKDAYQATMYSRETLGSDVRDTHTRIVDVDET